MFDLEKCWFFWKINFEKTPGLVLAATEVSRPQEPQEPLLTKSTKYTNTPKYTYGKTNQKGT